MFLGRSQIALEYLGIYFNMDTALPEKFVKVALFCQFNIKKRNQEILLSCYLKKFFVVTLLINISSLLKPQTQTIWLL